MVGKHPAVTRIPYPNLPGDPAELSGPLDSPKGIAGHTTVHQDLLVADPSNTDKTKIKTSSI